MFNGIYFNQQTFNWPAVTGSPFTATLQYNEYNFPNDNFRLVSLSGLESVENIRLNSFDIANGNGEGFSSYYFKKKQITVEGVMKADTVEELEAAIVTFKASILRANKNLKYNMEDGTTLITTASCTGLKVDREYYHLTFVPVTITFIVLDPFLYAQSSEETQFLSKSASFSSILDYTTWSVEAEPLIYIYFGTGLVGVTTVALTIGDTTLTVTETIADNDVLLIDCKGKDVKINDVWGNDYSGTFPNLEIGGNTFALTINGTWTADIYVLWQNTYA